MSNLLPDFCYVIVEKDGKIVQSISMVCWISFSLNCFLNAHYPQKVAVLGMQICLKYPHICIQMGVVEEGGGGGGGAVGSTPRAEHPEKEATHPE